METKANYLMIGGFVLGVLAFAFIFIFWISNFAGGGTRYLIVFENSVAGLTSGSSVGFNGIKVGEVQSFALDPDDGRKVQVLISVGDRTPVRENLPREHPVSGTDRRQRDSDHARHAEVAPSGGDGRGSHSDDRGRPRRGRACSMPRPPPSTAPTPSSSVWTISLPRTRTSINSTMSNVDEFTTMLKDQNEKISQTIEQLEKASKSFKTSLPPSSTPMSTG